MKRKLALCAAVLCLTMALSPSAFAAESVVISQSSAPPEDVYKRQLQLHVDRIFDHPRWVDFVPFNRQYRPEILQTAHLVTPARC